MFTKGMLLRFTDMFDPNLTVVGRLIFSDGVLAEIRQANGEILCCFTEELSECKGIKDRLEFRLVEV